MDNQAPAVQFPFGATSDEAATQLQVVKNPLGGPGDIVKRLGYQFEIPRAQPDAGMSRDMHGEN